MNLSAQSHRELPLKSSGSVLNPLPEKFLEKKKWELRVLRLWASILLAQVVPLNILPESLCHLGWGNLLSLPSAQYCR